MIEGVEPDAGNPANGNRAGKTTTLVTAPG